MRGKSERPQPGCNIAGNSYRARVLRVHEERPHDLDWRDDILYTAPKAYPSKLQISYRIQVISSDKTIHEIAYIRDLNEAKKRIKTVRRDLRKLPKTSFDQKYGIDDPAAEQVIVDPREVDEALYGNAMLFTGVQHKKASAQSNNQELPLDR